MRVYYFDDAGDRAQRTDKDPWFVLGGFGIDVEHIPALNHWVKNTSNKYGLNLEYPREIKFYHIGKSGHGKNENKKNWMVDAGITNMRQRRALGMSVLRHGIYLPSVRVISVAVDRRKLPVDENPVLPAVKLLLDRVQMDLQDFETNGFVLMDEENAMDKDLRQALRTGSGLIKKYTRILDTIAFMPSEESPGIQVADLVAGGIARYQNTNDPGFARIIWPRMRHRNGVQAGYGIKLHPNNPWVINPPEQTVPWPQFDRDVHDFEFQARGQTIHWSPDGRPSSVWQVLQVPSV